MEKPMKKPVRFYSSYTDDFVESKNQAFTLPDDYEWIPRGLWKRCLSGVIYGFAIVFSFFYLRLVLHLRICGKKKLRGFGGRYFLYGNHTQPIGDVFTPALCALPRRIFTVVSPANYGIPVIGKILPYLGALPITATPHGIRCLYNAMEQRLSKHHPIVVYPEAHVWEYYTGIRPFPPASFRFPVKFDTPSFAMTATYRKARFFHRPVTTVYIDGPFWAQGETAREKSAFLCKQLHRAMELRAKESDVSFIEYKKKEQD